ncbi:uncharacterized protein LOC135502987 [Lineus longissimus]|uniref:uncharacterized protein LOC135502987 n=1 Tax=Lineus longissimus TaxID=88925 RepID=UPI00315C4EE9
MVRVVAEWFEKVVDPTATQYVCGMNVDMKGQGLARKNGEIHMEIDPVDEAKHLRAKEISKALDGKDLELRALMDTSRMAIGHAERHDINNIAREDVDMDDYCYDCTERLAQMKTRSCETNGELAYLEPQKTVFGYSSWGYSSNEAGGSNALCNNKSGEKLAPGTGKKSNRSKIAPPPNDRASRRVRKLKEEWLKESKNGNKGKAANGKKSEHMDFVLNENGELCIRYKEKDPGGIETGHPTVEKCLDIARVFDAEAGDGDLAVLREGASERTFETQPKGGPKERAKTAPDKPVTIADHSPTPEEISEALGLDGDDLSDVDFDPAINEIWCRICFKFDRASRASYVCFECTERFCAACACRHECGIKERAKQRHCDFHMHHVSPPKVIQCNKCAVVKPLAKQKVQSFSAKGWRTDRFKGTEACDRKIKQLQDKQVIQFCKKKFNFDNTEHERIREHDEYLMMRERERQEMMCMRERDEAMRLRKREDMIRMRNYQMEMRMRERDEEMRMRQCDRAIQEHESQLQQTKAALKAMEDRKDALVRRKVAMIVKKEDVL